MFGRRFDRCKPRCLRARLLILVRHWPGGGTICYLWKNRCLAVIGGSSTVLATRGALTVILGLTGPLLVAGTVVLLVLARTPRKDTDW